MKALLWHPLFPALLLGLQLARHVQSQFQHITWISFAAFSVITLWLILAVINSLARGRLL